MSPRGRALRWRYAGIDEVDALAKLNRRLQREEGSAVLELPELRERLCRWLGEGYRAVIFEDEGKTVAYALFRATDVDSEGPDGIYLRQFYVVRDRRRGGFGRRAFETLDAQIWPPGKWILLDALASNSPGQRFWSALGFSTYSVRYRYQRPWQRRAPRRADGVSS